MELAKSMHSVLKICYKKKNESGTILRSDVQNEERCSFPFVDLGLVPVSGGTLRMNINRTKPGKRFSFEEETAWSPTFEGSSQVPSRFGIVSFR